MFKNLNKRLYTSVFLILLLIVIFIYKPILIFFLLIIGNLSIIEFSQIVKKIFKNAFYRLIFNSVFIIYIFLISIIFFIFSNFLISKIILFILVVCCIASDTGGYIFGNFFKGPKLTKISPNKTIIGAAGSLILTVSILQLIYFYFYSKLNLDVVLIGLIVSLACQIGDIFFSYLKRKAKVKDTSNFLPGHGGILDRIDGVLVAVPVGLILLSVLY